MINTEESSIIHSFQKSSAIGLYLHIPFCKGKCRYCDFYSVNCDQDLINNYLKHLKKEIKKYSLAWNTSPEGNRVKLDSIYFGGGTPGLLETEQIQDIMNFIIEELSYPLSGEITIEANPSSLCEEKIIAFKKVGITRLSLGVQSFSDKELSFLGRRHSAAQSLEIIDLLERHFDNYNMDLIFAIPGQTLKDWKLTLEKAISLGPEHISLYNLQIEEGTPLAKALENDEFHEVDDALDAEMYILAREMLISHGYQHYEISNFAQKGFQSFHNKIYWKLRPYLGLGPSAHSFTGNERYSNYSDILRYINELKDDKLPIDKRLLLQKEDLMAEYMFMGLRLLEGVSLSDFSEKFKIDLKSYYKDEIEKLNSMGLIEINNRLKLTEKGILHGNSVFLEFLP